MTVPDGFVPTPPPVADYVAAVLFAAAPEPGDRILFPGAGTGSLAAAVRRYCSVRDLPCPDGVAVDVDADRLDVFERRLSRPTPPVSKRAEKRLQPTYPQPVPSADAPAPMEIETVQRDFLLDPPAGPFDWIIANPPYTRYLSIDEDKRAQYRRGFDSAEGQFKLYMPFVEQMQRLLAPGGHLAFLAPYTYLTKQDAMAFRREVRRDSVEVCRLLPEESFPDHKVWPLLTVLEGTDTPALDGWFWSGEVRAWKLNRLLEHLGVDTEDDRQSIAERYYDCHQWLDRRLRALQRREGEEGGYKIERVPPEYRSGRAHQGELGRWSA